MFFLLSSQPATFILKRAINEGVWISSKRGHLAARTVRSTCIWAATECTEKEKQRPSSTLLNLCKLDLKPKNALSVCESIRGQNSNSVITVDHQSKPNYGKQVIDTKALKKYSIRVWHCTHRNCVSVRVSVQETVETSKSVTTFPHERIELTYSLTTQWLLFSNVWQDERKTVFWFWCDTGARVLILYHQILCSDIFQYMSMINLLPY